MNLEDDKLPPRLNGRKPDLNYFTTAMLKRYSSKRPEEVGEAIKQAQDRIAPSYDRTKLKREVMRILSST